MRHRRPVSWAAATPVDSPGGGSAAFERSSAISAKTSVLTRAEHIERILGAARGEESLHQGRIHHDAFGCLEEIVDLATRLFGRYQLRSPPASRSIACSIST
jgi:hypothetical protein